MPNLARTTCILPPLLLTLSTLICLLLTALPGTPPSHPTLPTQYFLRLNTSALHLNATQISRLPLPASLSSALSTALSAAPSALTTALDAPPSSALTQALNLSDWYTIHLWNYCQGPTNTTTPTSCSPPHTFFWFDPQTAWNLPSTTGANASAIFPAAALDTYRVAAKWMVVAYGVGVGATALELVAGVAALWSRGGALAAAGVGGVAAVGVVAFAVVATVVYSLVVGDVVVEVGQYGVRAGLGGRMFATVWLAVAFSLAGGVFWLCSLCCCCSGRSGASGKGKGGGDVEGAGGVRRGGWGYQRVEDRGVGGKGLAVPMDDLGRKERGTAYEPFRHQEA